MQAGLLRELITLIGKTQEQSASGFMKETTSHLITTRCRRIKKRSALETLGDKEVNTGTVTVQVRYNPIMDTASSFEYEGHTYRIVQALKQIEDRTLIIDGIKIPE